MLKSFFLLLLGGLSLTYGQVLEIPFELRNDILLMDIVVNDNDAPSTFIFDSGASTDVLGKETAESIGVKSNYQQNVPGAGGTQTYDIATGQSYSIQNTIRINNTNFVLVDLERLRDKLERDFYGIIGYSLLRGRVTKIDFYNKRMSLYNNIGELDTEGYKANPFKFGNGITIPQFDVEITLRGGQTYSGTVFFDSGAALSLSVNTPFNEKHKLNQNVKKSVVLRTENLGSSSVSEQIPIASMNLGGFELGEMVISLSGDQAGVSSYPGYLGILGADVISRFDVILDYKKKKLYLKPNANFDQPFEFPLSGISLRKDDQAIYVYNVQENCPAYELGIRKGDRIISIDQNNSGDIQTYRELLKQEGKTVLVKLKNSSGETVEVNLKLERLL